MAAAPETRRGLQRGPLDYLWLWLNSLPVAIWVMLLLAFFSMLGTIIPQAHLAQPEPGQTFEQLLQARYGDERAAVIHWLGFDHVYFTWYFFLLLLWLCVSAVICNIVRFRRTVKDWRQPTVRRGQSFFKGSRQAETIEPPLPGAAEQVRTLLRSQGYRVYTETDDKGVVSLYADKGYAQKWALVLLHLAVLVLLFGGIWGKTYGIQGSIRLADNENQPLVLNVSQGKHKIVQPLLRNLEPLVYDLDQRNFRIDYDTHLELPREIRDNIPEHLWDYYRYFVKDFVSILTASRNGVTVKKEVKVNHPLTIDKLVLYQSAYQQDGYLAVTIDGQTREFPALPQMWLRLSPEGPVPADNPGGLSNLSDKAFFLTDNVKDGDVYERSVKKGRIGPLVIVQLADVNTGDDLGQQLLSPEQGFETEVGGKPATVRMAQRVDNYSIFMYKRDPGLPVLYIGWIAMIIGVALSIYVPFGQLWLRVDGARADLLARGAPLRGTSLKAKLLTVLRAQPEAAE